MDKAKPYDPWLHTYYSRFGEPRSRADPPSVLFLVGSADISGGTAVIFEHALFAQRAGSHVRIATLLPLEHAADDWHPGMRELDFATLEEAASDSYDIVVATWWPTVMELPRFRFRHAVYFVQSAEARFNATGIGRQSAASTELTLRMGLPMITIATWLQAHLAFAHDAPSFLAHNGIRKEFYSPDGPRLAEPLRSGIRVLVEGSTEARFKGVKEAVGGARQGGADEVWLLTPSPVDEFPGCDRVISRIPASRCGEVYRSCDVMLKLTRVEGMFGPPLEMFHCGGTVVCYDVTGHDEYVTDGYNGIVVPMEDRTAAAAAIRSLREDPELLSELRGNALKTAEGWPDWDSASRYFYHLLRIISKQPPGDYLPSMMMAAGAPHLHERLQSRE